MGFSVDLHKKLWPGQWNAEPGISWAVHSCRERKRGGGRGGEGRGGEGREGRGGRGREGRRERGRRRRTHARTHAHRHADAHTQTHLLARSPARPPARPPAHPPTHSLIQVLLYLKNKNKLLIKSEHPVLILVNSQSLTMAQIRSMCTCYCVLLMTSPDFYCYHSTLMSTGLGPVHIAKVVPEQYRYVGSAVYVNALCRQ